MKISKFRRISQAVTLFLFSVLFFLTVYPLAEKIPVEFFLRLDPLVALVAMIGSRKFIIPMVLSVALLAATFVFGRFFCGYICPLGTLIDLSDAIVFPKKRKKESAEPKPNRKIKYYILIGVLAASLLGANFLHFFSPVSIAPRVFTTVIYPPIIWALNGILDLIRPAALSMGLDDLAKATFHRHLYATGIASLIMFLLIILANFWRRRFWCRYVCPTGAFLSLFSRFGIIKRKVDAAKCNDCKLCASKCDMRAIDIDPKKTILSECTLCGDCIDACNKDAVSIGFSPFGFAKENAALNIERRGFLQSAAAGIFVATSVKSGLNSMKNLNGRFIRPPGSIPESDFLAQCIRCGECMKVCKTNGLQPSFLECGFDGLWTPRLVPRKGPCEEKCNMCGQVCPTHAIRPLPLEEKRFVKIGTAVIDRRRCIAWEQNKLCLICDEICPYDAIEFRVVDDFTGPFKKPFVLEDKCTGCGYCEKMCPVYGRAAIEVFSIGEERKHKGSYITERKKEMREIKETHETLYDADALGSGGETGGDIRQAVPQEKQPKQEEESLPGGFIIE